MHISNLGNLELNHYEFWIQEGQILPSWTVMAKAASLKFLRLYFLVHWWIFILHLLSEFWFFWVVRWVQVFFNYDFCYFNLIPLINTIPYSSIIVHQTEISLLEERDHVEVPDGLLLLLFFYMIMSRWCQNMEDM